MPRLLLFNPSHEMALAADTAYYTPPKQVLRMEADLCTLPLLVAEKDDAILTPQGITGMDGERIARVSSLVPTPWGWNKSVRNRFVKLGLNPKLMPTMAELDEWRLFASRRWAAEYNKELYDWTGSANYLVDNEMAFCPSTQDTTDWIGSHSAHPYILKSEYSSSGRGNRIGNGMAAANNLQATNVLADRFYNKRLDFAMEFRITADDVEYIGLSVFEASKEGRYMFNHLSSQSELKDMVGECLKGNGEQTLDHIADVHTKLLAKRLVGRYKGMAGIDMMVTDDGKLHPCVEINMRMNMGILSIMLYERGIKEVSPSVSTGKLFRPVIDTNKFYIKIEGSAPH